MAVAERAPPRRPLSEATLPQIPGNLPPLAPPTMTK
jgi:hypothetical protein